MKQQRYKRNPSAFFSVFASCFLPAAAASHYFGTTRRTPGSLYYQWMPLISFQHHTSSVIGPINKLRRGVHAIPAAHWQPRNSEPCSSCRDQVSASSNYKVTEQLTCRLIFLFRSVIWDVITSKRLSYLRFLQMLTPFCSLHLQTLYYLSSQAAWHLLRLPPFVSACYQSPAHYTLSWHQPLLFSCVYDNRSKYRVLEYAVHRYLYRAAFVFQEEVAPMHLQWKKP